MTRTRAILLISMILLCAACSSPGQSGNQTYRLDQQADARTLLSLHNRARANDQRCSDALPASSQTLKWNNKLARAARRHAKDLSEQEFLQHRGSDGSSTAERVNSAGYRWAKYGENISWGQADAQAATQSWLGSATHCENLMDPAFTEFGAAMQDGYWVAVFGKPRDW